MGSRFGVLSFGVLGLEVLGLGFWVLRFWVWGFWVWGSGFGVLGLRLWFSGSGIGFLVLEPEKAEGSELAPDLGKQFLFKRKKSSFGRP